MMYSMSRHLYLIGAALVMTLISCATSEEKKEENVSQVLAQETPVVDVKVLRRGDFAYETISNGKVEAARRADLNFSASEVVTKIYAVNGQTVKKGQKIAQIDDYKLKNRLLSAKSSLDKAYLSLQEALISRWYNINDTTSVPESEMKLLRTKSGYEDSRNAYNLALYEYENATLYAPFDGVVANLFTQQHNVPAGGKPFCTVIGTGSMLVDFAVLESELVAVRRGGEVEIRPFSGSESRIIGRITQINPVVDETGLIRVKAVVDNPTAELYDGMNVRVVIRNTVAAQLAVPKTAVVNRSGGRKVVFSYKRGMAVWNYVEEGDDNSSDIIISSGLKEGDTIIVSGNANLTYDVRVKVNKIIE